MDKKFEEEDLSEDQKAMLNLPMRGQPARPNIINAAEIERCVIGIRSRIGTNSVIKNTYMIGSNRYQDLDEMQSDKAEHLPHIGVGDGCHIANAIIDKDARIGNGVVIIGGDHLPDREDDKVVIKDGVVVVRRRAVLPDGYELK